MKLSEAITKEELRALSAPSDIRAVFGLAVEYALLITAFAIAIVWPNPLTVLLAVLLLAGRQQALAVITHDCAHYHFFRSRKANEFVGRWLAGGAMNVPFAAYRDYHLQHHRHAGTDQDPDRWMVAAYPVTAASMRRKLIRDLTGQTGLRDTMREIKSFNWPNNAPWLVFNAALLSALAIAGATWAYLMWWAARLFVFPAIYRLRQVSEHGVVPNRDSLDARENTGTTLLSWWERIFIAPAHVNYHLEHHMFAAVPPYNLPRVHRLLKSRGYYDGHDCLSHGFRDVLRRAVQREQPVPVK